MAFVIVQHLAPDHESILPNLLARKTTLPVSEVRDGDVVDPNHVYVLPPNANLSISKGVLKLEPLVQTGRQRQCIDHFFESLAKDRKERSIGVVLSGTAFDGTFGVEAIKAEGGITFAQDPQSARYSGMPKSAVSSGHVDYVLPPEGVARELSRLSRHPYLSPAPPAKEPVALPAEPQEKDPVRSIFKLLWSATGVDFTNYKSPTIRRRIARRMALDKIESLEALAGHLKRNPGAVQVLFQDLLIPTTCFFRDPEVFQALKDSVIPAILKEPSRDEPIRVWVPGCSTGEEPYSIAIGLAEALEERLDHPRVQIFATDLSEKAIQQARQGLYPFHIEADVSPERLRRFFYKTEKGYQISKPLRDWCVFARHDITRDSPFSNLDLISCRNVLIYLEPSMQKKVLHVFHYALKPAGALILGTSESVGEAAPLYAPLDKKLKIFTTQEASHPLAFRVAGPGPKPSEEFFSKHRPASLPLDSEPDMSREANRVFRSHAPPAVVIDEDLTILEFSGDTGPYLLAASGKASFSLLKMLREGLISDLRRAIDQAQASRVPVKTERLQVESDDLYRPVQIEAVPLFAGSDRPRHFVIFFHSLGSPIEPDRTMDVSGAEVTMSRDEQVERLKRELSAVKGHLQSTIERYERANEDLQTASQEILSSNEELQSTNEELETAQEELQAANEELMTLNDELSSRNAEMGQTNSDLVNLLDSVNIAIVMVDQGLRIRRFTPMAGKILNLIPGDVGRSIGSVKSNLRIDEILRLTTQVIDTVGILEQEVQDLAGRWYSLRIRPYRTAENKLDGAVVALIDIDTLKRLESDLAHAIYARDQFMSIASHELKGPLTTLKLHLQNTLRLVRKGDADALSVERFVPILEKIDRQGERLTKMIGNLLDVSRITAGKLQLEPEEFELADLVRSVADSFKDDLEHRSQELSIRAVNPARGQWDRSRVEQVVRNLLGNAIKYGEGKPIEVRIESDASLTRLSVKDRGIGISPEQQKRIFAPYERAVTSRRFEGLGLGLFISRQIVAAHGGTITLDSAPGKGSTFTVELPTRVPSRAETQK